MYKEYFGLKEEPFSIAPDPQFLYMSERHREALAHLIYGMKADSGFVLLTGEVGTGKTTVCRCLLNQIPEHSEVAFVLNPKLSVPELLATICDELGISYPVGTSSIKIFVDQINLFLLDAHSQGKRTILIIDEAQNLSIEVLEQIRLLTNLETSKRKLLQVIMLGQPELNHLLARPELRQLAQRVTARYHLEPLSRHELVAYLTYRLAVAGVERPLFPKATINRLYRLSGGIPRLINLICDRALLGAYARGESLISPKLLAAAAAEVFGKTKDVSPWFGRLTLGLLVAVVVLVGGVGVYSMMPMIWQEPVTRISIQRSDETALDAELSSVEPPLIEIPAMEEVPIPAVNWPGSAPKAHSRDLAFKALLALWGHVQPPDSDVPLDVPHFGLEFLEERGSFARLRQLNHPAVLRLADPEGEDVFYVTLTALDEETATLVIGSDILRVPMATLMNQWLGDFTLLWQPPPGYQRVLRAGDEGITVLWLEQRLAELAGRDIREFPELYFDQTMEADVRQFQREENLAPDGLVGPNTLIRLNARSESEQPRLATRRGGY